MKITITRHEGPTNLCNKPVVVENPSAPLAYAAASKVFSEIAMTAPESGGYDKVGFVVQFDPVFSYAGRADITRNHFGYDLKAHMACLLKHVIANKERYKATEVEEAGALLAKVVEVLS